MLTTDDFLGADLATVDFLTTGFSTFLVAFFAFLAHPHPIFSPI